MAYILGLESSSEVCSVCISKDGELLNMVETKEAFSHTRKMTLYIKECLEAIDLAVQDLSAVAVSHGPGSYTGLRVSAATAKGLCFGLRIPLISIDTLEAIAWRARSLADADRYIPMIDARRMEVYAAVYDPSLRLIEETDNVILDSETFARFASQKTVLCGTGVEKAKDLFEKSNFILEPFDLSASYMITLAHEKFLQQKFENLVSYSPNYFKAPNITSSKKPLF